MEKLRYSDPDHPMFAVFSEMRKEPQFKNYTYDEIVALIDNETRLQKRDAKIGSILAVPIVFVVGYFVLKLLQPLLQ